MDKHLNHAVEIVHFGGQLGNSNIKKADLYASLKIHVDFDLMKKILKKYENHPLTRKFLDGKPLPKIHEDVRKEKTLWLNDDLIKELNWTYLAIQKYVPQINAFLSMKDQFEKHLLIGDYLTAREILKKIEKDICVSLWSIEQLIILEEFQFGEEKNWNTVNTLNSKNIDVYVAVLGVFYSLKAERAYPDERYHISLKEWLYEQAERHKMPNYAKEYFDFKLDPFLCYEFTYKDFSHILLIESTSSIIDRYLTFIRICTYVISNQMEDDVTARIISILTEFDKIIDDINITQNLIFNNQFSFKNRLFYNETYLLLEKYRIGDYVQAAEIAFKLLNNEINIFEYLEIYIKSRLLLGNNVEEKTNDSILENTLYHMFNFLNRTDDEHNSLNQLLKIAQTMNNSSWGYQLFSFLDRYITDRIIANDKNDVNYGTLLCLNSKIYNPRLAKCFKREEQGKQYLNALKSFVDNSDINLIFKDLVPGNSDNADLESNISPFIISLSNASRLIQNQKFEEALCLLLPLKISNISIPYLYERIVYYIYVCFYMMGDISNCIKVFVDSYLLNENYVIRFEKKKVLQLIDDSFFSILNDKSNLIELPIFYSINAEDDQLIYFAYDEYLSCNNISKPSDLILTGQDIPSRKLILFLSKVCVPEVLFYSLNFESTEDIENERIKICQFLSDTDKENSALYREEISQIIKMQSVRKAIRQVDQSKIYVNIENLKKSIQRTLKEDFNRYIKLRQFQKGNEYKSIGSIVWNLFKDDEELPLLITYSKNPLLDYFVKMFLEVRNEFISSNEYGLDAYISTRIRHGTLQNHIRSIFESHHLISEKNDQGTYNHNKFWDSKLNFLGEKQLNEIHECLGEFSENIDRITKFIREENMQIKTEIKNPHIEALFDYSYSDLELVELYENKFKTINNYDDFINEVLNNLWEKTEKILENIRGIFSDRLKTQFAELLSDLQFKLGSIDKTNSLNDLYSALAIGRTKSQEELNIIAEWFRISEKKTANDFKIQTAIETSLQITNNIFPEYNLRPEITIDSNKTFKGESFNHFIDIIRILLDNIVRHSKLTDNNINASINIWDDQQNIIMIFTNTFSESINEDDLRNIFEKIKSDFKGNKPLELEKINREGGSGFFKIKKILASDLNRENTDFDFHISKNSIDIYVEFEHNNLISHENFDNRR